MYRKVMAFAFVFCLTLAAYASFKGAIKQSPFDLKLTHTIDSTGDTAQIIKVHLFTARDSFTYKDTINDTPIVWTSPLQVRRFDVGLDTSITYSCTLDAGTNKYGFTYDATGETNLLDSIIEHLVDSFNAVAGMSDTVTAHDSVTYIKVVSKFAMDELEGDARWTLVLMDSTTETDSTFTTIAMVCDSMSAYINAHDTVSAYVTGANSGDTVYTITSDDLGLSFTIEIGDTAQDTSLTQANVTSYSTASDTLGLFSMCCPEKWNSMLGHIIIRPSHLTAKGYGLADSGFIYLYAYFDGAYHLLDSDSANSLPCSLLVVYPDTSIIADTLYKEDLRIGVKVTDSATDTTMDFPHPIIWRFVVQQ